VVKGFFLVKYTIEGNVLLMWKTDDQAKLRAWKAGKLKGVIQADGATSRPSGDATEDAKHFRFTDTTENLARFVAAEGDTVFEKTPRRLERIQQVTPVEAPPAPKKRVSEVTIPLTGAVSEVTGYAWPRLGGKLVSSTDIKPPCRATVQLPSGRKFTRVSHARDVYAEQVNGKICRVHLLPLEEPGSFGNAIREMRSAASDLDNKALREVAEKFAKRGAASFRMNRYARVEIEKGVRLEVMLRFDSEAETWDVKLSFFNPELWEEWLKGPTRSGGKGS
jgi:hypothetical protein